MKKGLSKIIIYMLSGVMCAGMLAGCTNQASDVATPGSVVTPPINTTVGSMEDSAVLDYDTPIQQPRIIVDRAGYSAGEVKYAWIVAEQMPASFSIVDESDGKVVLEIEPESVKYDETNQVYNAKVKFGELNKAGTYHIEESSLGQSFSFVIEENYYTNRFNKLVESECNKCKDNSASAEEIYSLIYIAERYPSTIPDKDKFWDAVNGWITAVNTDGMSGDVTGMFVAILAKAGFNQKTSETIDSKELISQAEKLYGDISSDDSLEKDTEFVALAELYRATGKRNYGSELSDMYDYIKSLDNIHTSRKLLYGSMCYMSTNNTVNRSMCDVFMQSLLMSCEDISWDKTLIAPQNAERTDTDVLLDYAQQLIAMNYVLDGYQYNELVVSITHYMSGRNFEGYQCNIEDEYSADAIVLLSWLTLLEKNGKLDPSAPVEWEYSW